jgi:hypothetical protein
MNRTLVLGTALWLGLACAASCASGDKPRPGVRIGPPVDTGPSAPLPPPTLAKTPASAATPAPVCRPPSAARAFERRTGFTLSPEERTIMDDCPSRAWSKKVPLGRLCTKDDECDDGFCERGKCSAIWTCDARNGQRCETDDHCPKFSNTCIDGRCRFLLRSEFYERKQGIKLSLFDEVLMDTCPKRAWTHNVPKRRCTNDGQCGDGFCDQGRCVARWTCDAFYGEPCSGEYCGRIRPCINGRCRSCTAKSGCEWRTEGVGESNITCMEDEKIPGARMCEPSEVGSVPGGVGLPCESESPSTP